MRIPMKKNNLKFYAPRNGILATIIYLLTYSAVLLFDRLVTRTHIRGREHLDEVKGGGFVISNHVLYLDPALICVALYPRRLFFSAMEETFRIPVIRSYIRFLGAFPVSSHMPGSVLIRNVGDMLKEGRLVHFFPEGNLLHLSRKLQDFKAGVFALAVHFGKPIIPLTIVTKPRKVLGERLNKYLCRVEITIGKPIYPREFSLYGTRKKETVELMCTQAQDIIQHELDSVAG
jgi:1,2-diacylglycerol 3-alpha-glucosyltransferase